MNEKFSLTSTIKISDDTVFRNLQDEIVLLNLKNGMYYGLDVVGAKTWQFIEKHQSLQKVHDLLMKEFDVTEEQCAKDLLDFVSSLHEKKLIEC